MTLRIALTHAFCWPEVRRGGERYLHELGAALARRKHRVTIISGGRRPGVGEQDGVRVVRLPRGAPDNTERAEKLFGAVAVPALAGGRFDVVHSLGVRDAVASLRAKRLHPGRRTVYTCLGIPEDWYQDSIPTAADHFRVVDEIDVYGCLSQFARQQLLDGYGRAGAITPGGVHLSRFRPVAERAAEPTLLFSGVLDEGRKGVAELLQAVAILASTEPRVRLWLSGPGDADGLLRAAPAEARDRTEVLPLGKPEDQPRRYASAWVTALPARYEAFGLVLIESLACGTPVVVADHSSLPELAQPGVGVVAGIGELPGNPAALADALAQALTLARENGIVERCRAAAEPYDWDEGIVPMVEALYHGTIRDAGAA
jgi:glycosyltransferase involved in cell wall biosynthesis